MATTEDEIAVEKIIAGDSGSERTLCLGAVDSTELQWLERLAYFKKVAFPSQPIPALLFV